jgi:SAM-dependent methyltransferase
MVEFWEQAFDEKQLMWGLEPAASATLACDYLAARGAVEVLIPGVGYGRNALPFLARGMSVTGVEISQTAIALARSGLGLQLPIHHGSVEGMPYDDACYDGIFCHGLLYLLGAEGRARFLRACAGQLSLGGHLIVSVISKEAPMYGQGACVGEDRFQRLPNLEMSFYDEGSLRRELGPYGLIEVRAVEEPAGAGASLPFLLGICQKA